MHNKLCDRFQRQCFMLLKDKVFETLHILTYSLIKYMFLI